MFSMRRRTSSPASKPLSPLVSIMSDSEEEPIFDPDWHHTENAGIYLHALGLLSIEWNMTEHYMSMLVAGFMSNSPASAPVAMSMGNQSKTDALLTLASTRNISKIGMKHIEFAAACFNRLRENRNILLHSHSMVPRKGQKIEFRRARASAPTLHLGCLTTLDEIGDNLVKTIALGQFISVLWIKTSRARHMKKSGLPWPNIFPLPNKLTQLPPEVRPE